MLAFNEALSHLATHDPDPADFDSVAVWVNLGDCGHDAHMPPADAARQTAEPDATRTPGSVVDDGLGSSELGWAALRRVLTPDSPALARHLGTRVPIAEVAVLREDGTEAGGRGGPARGPQRGARARLLESLRHHVPHDARRLLGSPATSCAARPTVSSSTWTGRSTGSGPRRATATRR
ncbi:hypothetical protein SMICM304S_08280 [Streptomyces microflavus]